jgi:hypothetical protein
MLTVENFDALFSCFGLLTLAEVETEIVEVIIEFRIVECGIVHDEPLPPD